MRQPTEATFAENAIQQLIGSLACQEKTYYEDEIDVFGGESYISLRVGLNRRNLDVRLPYF